MMTVNLGTQGLDSARELVEYCNFPGGTQWSDLRKKNGAKDPYNIKVWCLGNEMDGPWQIGQKTAQEYASIAVQAGKAMKLVDPSIELVVCGSAMPSLPTYPEWEREVLEHSYEQADYICLHSYYGNQSGDTDNFLARNIAMAEYIRTVESICDYTKAKLRSRKTMMLSFDEWNVWYHSNEADRHIKHWAVAPAQSEEDYTMLDALVFGSCFITLLNHSDRVKMACVAQLVNVLAPIIALPGGPCYCHTTYYPWKHVSEFGRGTALRAAVNAPVYDCADFEKVPYVDAAVVLSEDESAITIFAVNKNLEEALPVTLKLNGFTGYSEAESITMHSPSADDGNTPEEPNLVVPARGNSVGFEDGLVHTILPRASWNVIRLRKK